jgi:hypothetical protein
MRIEEGIVTRPHAPRVPPLCKKRPKGERRLKPRPFLALAAEAYERSLDLNPPLGRYADELYRAGRLVVDTGCTRKAGRAERASTNAWADQQARLAARVPER